MSNSDNIAALAGKFGPDFVWGVSTASYQIEGAVDEDGRGRSVWDDFCDTPGAVLNGESGAVACDHYHRFRDDVQLMSELGVDAYRFSISWPRIQPDGSRIEQRGLDFYDRLVDALLEKGIQPSPTLFHWDSPAVFESNGGWQNRAITDRFAEYAHIVSQKLGDRVTRWMTINETNIFTLLGHAIGEHAPGKELGFDALNVAWNLMLAHGKATQAMRANGIKNIGIANNHAPIWPVGGRQEDIDAAGLYDIIYNKVFLDPILRGTWPLAGLIDPEVAEAGDLAIMRQPLDFLGINHYNPQGISAPSEGAPFPFDLVDVPAETHNDFGWPIVPEGFTELLVGLKAEYGDALPPIYITENGGAFNETPDEAGRVRDQRRIDYTHDHLLAIKKAMDADVDVRGYFHWSFMDNFEWAEGYSKRFGLVFVDYETQQRIPKDSFHWYNKVITSQK
ncbi:MAG: beta-glucosidase [Aeromicrobium sp.]|nr:MAG: beta-glucosidase [Aeromicrobium sp.]